MRLLEIQENIRKKSTPQGPDLCVSYSLYNTLRVFLKTSIYYCLEPTRWLSLTFAVKCTEILLSTKNKVMLLAKHGGLHY